ncbi:hypothetical protein [Cesiribacter sp. SM1]|uniref:hypothetical protein n=1 Tax=Cesiribacter sp. SM1 TaxID=2861196 RepID=UPI001CD67C54|nr:hypothetical protein [Cesiribacter sp. SM1]
MSAIVGDALNKVWGTSIRCREVVTPIIDIEFENACYFWSEAVTLLPAMVSLPDQTSLYVVFHLLVFFPKMPMADKLVNPASEKRKVHRG